MKSQLTKVPDWHLAYHHDKEGNAISGSKAKLIELILHGRSVRIVWSIRKDFAHISDAGFLTIMNNDVFAQVHGIIRQIPDRNNKNSIALDAKEQSNWHSIFSTNGEMQSFQSSKGILNSRQMEYKWYVFY